MDQKYKRYTQTAVTVFIHHGDDYLLLLRDKNKSVDPVRLNGVGGRLELGEEYLTASVRETIEETGYKVTKEEMKFSGIVRLQDGYPEDWIMCYFTIEVSSKIIPHGNSTDDGELMWMSSKEVLSSDFKLVDNLHYCFEDIVKGNVFFLSCILNTDHKIIQHTKSYLE
ncbi:MAG: NUDIX domain-containing protein [Candidatus Roizmanbacteria bacterium]